jgi:hypothetical protein
MAVVACFCQPDWRRRQRQIWGGDATMTMVTTKATKGIGWGKLFVAAAAKKKLFVHHHRHRHWY